MAIKTIFLDRDGVINKDNNYVHEINDFEFIDGIFNACLYFQNLGYQLIIITNQSGISRGYFDENQYKLITDWMVTQFKKNQINILDIFHCPHGPMSNCNCRKPKAGMLFDAQIKYNINMKKSWMIGDSERDIEAAINAKIKNTILLSNLSKPLESKAKYITDSLLKIKKIITS